MTRPWTWLCACAMLLSCGVTTGSPGTDTTTTAEAGDGRTATNDGAGGGAGGGVVPGGGGGAPTDEGTSKVAGQCAADTDCGGGLVCSVRAPGGFCTGCGSAGDCPSKDGRSYACSPYGSCNQRCVEDSDCPAPLRCSDSAGVCILRSCDSCPAPYLCEGNVCVRRPCDANCPPGKCSGGYCVDDF